MAWKNYLDFVGKKEVIKTKLIINLPCWKEKKDKNYRNTKKKKHNHLTLIVLVRLLAVVFLYLLASSLSVKHKKI